MMFVRHLVAFFTVYLTVLCLGGWAQAREVEIRVDNFACNNLLDHGRKIACFKTMRNALPVFIFIPGILGSELRDNDGKVLWGTSTSATEKLDFLKYPKRLRAYPLGDYKVLSGIFSEDIYGKMYSTISRASVGSVTNFLYFPYDWRQSNADSAEALDNWLQSPEVAVKIKDRKVVFVAHSMGGLVYRFWYKNIFKPQPAAYAFKELLKTYFLAVPHEGSPQAFFRIHESKLFEGIEEKLLDIIGGVPRRIAKIGYTFPSIYQLLSADTKWFQIKGAAATPVLIYDPEVWVQMKLMDKIVAKSGVKIEQVSNNVRGHLKNAETFHNMIGACHDIPNATHFYSRDIDTRSRATIIIKGNFNPATPNAYTTEVDWIDPVVPGDGTVPETIADCTPAAKTVSLVSGNHISMTKSEAFLVQVAKEIERQVYAANRAYAAELQNNPAGISDLARAGRLLEMPSATEAGGTQGYKAIFAANKLILDEILRQGNKPKFSTPFDITSDQNTLALNRLAANFSPIHKQRLLANNRLGYTFFVIADRIEKEVKSSNSELSISLFKQSKNHLDLVVASGAAARESLLRAARNTRGAVNYRLGFPEEAKADLRDAAVLGNTKAEMNLKRLFNIEIK